MRRAKIVCTLGPAVARYEDVLELVRSGMDVARLNLSHGAHEDHETAYDNVRRASDETGRAVCIFGDLQGPKIRLGRFADGPVELAKGARFTITTDDVLGTVERSSTTYKGLPGDVARGRHDPGRRRQGQPAGAVGRGRRRAHRGGRPGPGEQQQGPQPAGGRRQRPRAVREGRRRPALGAAHRRRHGRAVVRPQRRGRRGRPRDHARGWATPSRSSPRSRSRRRSRTSTRSCRPSTRSWSPAATSASSCRWSRCRSCRSARSRSPAATPSPSSSPPRCWSR